MQGVKKLVDENDIETSSHQGSIVSANFGPLQNNLKTPGFTTSKTFEFSGGDKMQEDDDVSSMHSKEMHFGGANKRSRAFSGFSSDLKDSDTSSEMIEALNDKEVDLDGQMTRISGNSII